MEAVLYLLAAQQSILIRPPLAHTAKVEVAIVLSSIVINYRDTLNWNIYNCSHISTKNNDGRNQKIQTIEKVLGCSNKQTRQ